MLTRVSIRHEWQHLYKEVMIKGGSHAENVSACETQNHIGRLTRPFFGSGVRDYDYSITLTCDTSGMGKVGDDH